MTPVTGSRAWAFVRHRALLRRTWALVSAGSQAPGNSTLRDILGPTAAYWVSTGENTTSFSFQLTGAAAGEGHSVNITLIWWVHDPRTAVRRRVLDGHSHVRRDVEQRLAKWTSTRYWASLDELEDNLDAGLRTAVALETVGISYGYGHVELVAQSMPAAHQAEIDDLRWATAVETERQHLERTRLRYYEELVTDGPQALLAYWIQRHPDDIKHIVEYVRQHRAAPATAAPGPTETADPTDAADRQWMSLLETMTAYERQQIRQLVAFGVARTGSTVAEMLSTLGEFDTATKDRAYAPNEEPAWP